MHELERLIRKPNAIAVLAAAGLGGWLLGSGVFALPFSLPSLSLGHAPASPTAAAPAPATLPVSSAQAATLSTTSASMPGAGSIDPLAGWNV